MSTNTSTVAKIKRYYSLMYISEYWADTPMSINASVVVKILQLINPLETYLNLGPKNPHTPIPKSWLKNTRYSTISAIYAPWNDTPTYINTPIVKKITIDYTLRDVYYPWTDTPMSVNTSIIVFFSSKYPLRAIAAPWDDTNTSTNATNISIRKIVRYFTFRDVLDPWDYTPTSTNTLRIKKCNFPQRHS